MSNSHGRFVWYELMTTDTGAAEAFYREVVGWKTNDAGMPGMAYTILSAGDAGVGGLAALPEAARAAGARPAWNGYIAVDDVDRRAAQVEQTGGRIHYGPDDIATAKRRSIISGRGLAKARRPLRLAEGPLRPLAERLASDARGPGRGKKNAARHQRLSPDEEVRRRRAAARL